MVTAILIVGVASLAIVATTIVRERLSWPILEVLLAVEGSALAVGGLLLLDDVGTGSWIAGPLALAVLTPVHVRALFAGEGPFRT